MSGAEIRWSDFFVAEVGATAALTGLIIVAISINLQRILAGWHLPGRALEALVLLLGAMLICSVALIPGQAPARLGFEILGIVVLVLLNSIVRQIDAVKHGTTQQPSWIAGRAIVVILMGVPIVIGGIMLTKGNADGLYWIAPGILVAIAASIMNTWVLLIEILR